MSAGDAFERELLRTTPATGTVLAHLTDEREIGYNCRTAWSTAFHLGRERHTDVTLTANADGSVDIRATRPAGGR